MDNLIWMDGDHNVIVKVWHENKGQFVRSGFDDMADACTYVHEMIAAAQDPKDVANSAVLYLRSPGGHERGNLNYGTVEYGFHEVPVVFMGVNGPAYR